MKCATKKYLYGAASENIGIAQVQIWATEKQKKKSLQ